MDITFIHPGAHLAYELETLNMTASDLARQVQVPLGRIRKIINGQEPITGDIALRLAHFFGTPAPFWMNLQAVYELQVAHHAIGQSIEKLPTLKATELNRSPALSDRAGQRSTKRTEQERAEEDKRSIPHEGYMRLPAVLSVFPVSRSTWWAGISAGRFPKGVKLGPRITAWKVEDIRKLIDSRK